MLAARAVIARVFNPGDIRSESLSLLFVVSEEPLPPVTIVFLPLTAPSLSDDDFDGAAADPFTISTLCTFGAVPDACAADLACGICNLRDVIPVPAVPYSSALSILTVCREKSQKLG